MKKNFTVIIFTLFFSTTIATAAVQNRVFSDGMMLIPRPQSIEIVPGYFEFSPNMSIVVTNSKDESDCFAAEQLRAEIEKSLGWSPEIKRGGMRGEIILARFSSRTTLKRVLERFDPALIEKIGDQGYVLDIEDDKIVICAKSGRGLFYGVQTLRQLIRANMRGGVLPALRIVDWPALMYRGWQDDISRGPIPTIEFLKEEIVKLSEFKMNLFTLYTEHVFKLKKHPEIAPPEGITREEVEELVKFAEKYHVEIAGNFQSFGHFRNILRVPKYSHLKETDNLLTPAKEESYEFLRDVYDEIAPAYRSPLFNINCDETFGLGRGPAKAMVDTMGKGGVYAYHINRIYNLLKPYNKRIMMWGDIARDYPEIIPELPDDIIVLPWAYHAADSFDSEIRPFKEMGFDFIVCPGVSCWRRIWPDFRTAMINISNFVRDGAECGAAGMLNTTWDDDGENLFNYNWYLLAWGAECGWNPIIPENSGEMERLRKERMSIFNLSFDPIFFDLSSNRITPLLSRLSDLRRFKASSGLRDGPFWKGLVEEIKEHNIQDADSLLSEAVRIRGLLEAEAERVGQNQDAVECAVFAAKRICLLAEKEMLRKDLIRGVERPEQIKERLFKLKREVIDLRDEYQRLWKTENRSWWLDRNLKKYDDLADDIENTTDHVFIVPDSNLFSRQRRVVLKPVLPADFICYTTDGSIPDSLSKRYTGPFLIDTTSTVKTRPFRDGRAGSISTKEIFVYRGHVNRIELENMFSQTYPADGIISLVDGKRGSSDFRDGKWQGYQKNDFIAVLDLGRARFIRSISTGFLQNTPSWILFPLWVEYSFSDDGENFTSTVRVKNRMEQNIEGSYIQYYKADIGLSNVRYIKVVARNVGRLPEWHRSRGGDAWLFVDEITID